MGQIDLRRGSVLGPAESGCEDGEGNGDAPKYAIEASIGQGGMGEVFLVEDRDLGRQVAMKVLRRDRIMDEHARVHFVAEAQATSQLEHPGVPPVHDLGVTADGRVYFTMKLIRGRTLREVLHDLVLRRRDVQQEYNLHRRVTIISRIAETLQFAHERGVLPRDITPENIMIGDYGEVHLVDWGLARVDRLPKGVAFEDIEHVATARTGSGLETEYGTIKGTLAYMSPEQATGRIQDLDGRSDVFALGLVLYEVLTLQPAYDAQADGLLRRVASADVVDVGERNPKREIPSRLAEVVRRAVAANPDDRFQSARDMASALQSWLDGTSERDRRHEEAERLAREGRTVMARHADMLVDLHRARGLAAEVAAGFKAYQPVVEKRAQLEAEVAVGDLERDIALAFADATHLLNAALVQEEHNASARAALADLWKGKLESAESGGDVAEAAHALSMIKRYDDGRLGAFVEGTGQLTLRSDPPAADVVVFRYAEQDGALVETAAQSLGATPVEGHPLPMGSYLCVLKCEGFADVRYPLHITRNRHWNRTVRMRSAEQIGEAFVYVPGGPFAHGEGVDAKELELPDFAIQRLPVTFADFAEFLSALETEGGLEAAQARIPGQDGEKPYMVRSKDGCWRVRPDLVEGEARDACIARHGEDFEMRLPVLAVSAHDAEAYCEWRTRLTGRVWRLPTEQEREKAARGVDGRRFPWGDRCDASLAKCRDSRPEDLHPEPVGAFASAVSVYGMRDAAGGAWDWTASWYDDREVLRTLRGGSWFNPPEATRCANRLGDMPTSAGCDCGFRCARGL